MGLVISCYPRKRSTYAIDQSGGSATFAREINFLNTRQLRYFCEVVRTQNFSRAAEELHIAQPALSRQIQKLEDELKVSLVDRSCRPLKITRAGIHLYEQASQILSRLEELKKTTQRVHSEDRNWVGVGFVPSILYGGIPKTIQAFSSSHANIDITMTEMVSAQQVEAIKSRRIDVGFGRLAISDDAVSNTVLTEEPLVVALSSNHCLAQSSSLPLSDIVKETLILYPATPKPNYSDQVLRQFKVRGLEVSKTYETNGLQTAIGMAAAGMGLAIVPKSVQLLQRADIIYLPILGNELTSPLIMTTRNEDISPHVRMFIETVETKLFDPSLSNQIYSRLYLANDE